MSYPYPPRAEIGRAMVDDAFAEAAQARAATATLHPDEQAELDALMDALNEQHQRSTGDVLAAPESTEALDAYDDLCEATFCMQCDVQTDAKEGSLCTGCALQGMDDMDDHERAHAAGRV